MKKLETKKLKFEDPRIISVPLAMITTLLIGTVIAIIIWTSTGV